MAASRPKGDRPDLIVYVVYCISVMDTWFGIPSCLVARGGVIGMNPIMATWVMKTHFFGLFSIHYAPVICNHCPPHLRGRVGDDQAKVWCSYFSSVPAVYGK